MTAALVMMLVLGAEPEAAPEVSANVEAYLDAAAWFKARQIRRTKEAIVWIENKLAADTTGNKYTPLQLARWKPALVQLRKTLRAMEAAKIIKPQLDLAQSSPEPFPVGYVGELPAPYSEFFHGSAAPLESEARRYHCQYSFAERTNKGSLIEMARYWNRPNENLTSSRPNGIASMYIYDFPEGLTKGERVEKHLAKVYRIKEASGQRGYVLEPFDMTEVDAFLKRK